MARLRIWSILLFLAVAGCSDAPQSGSSSSGSANSSGSAASETSADKSSDASKSPVAVGNSDSARKKIGFSALTLTNPFFQIIGETMAAEGQKQGYDVVVVSGEQDVNRQTAQIEDFIVQGVSAIVLNPCDSKAIGTAIRKANDAGIPVFTNDIKYDGTDGKVVCHIATDNFQGGKLAGEAMVKLLGETGGKVAVIDYPDVESCQLRVRGFREILDAHNAKSDSAKIEIVTVLNGKGAREAGHAAARDAIQAHPDLAALFAINDPSALGARVALEESGKVDQVAIIGFDGAIEGKEAILKGDIVCDPIQFPESMGKTTIEMIGKYFDGEDVPAEILIPSALYYREDALKDPALQKK